MAISAKMFGPAIAGQFGTTAARRVDWASDTIKASLHTSAWTPNQDTQDFADDLTNEVANGSGYTTGGVTLAGKTVTYDAASNKLKLDANDLEWEFTAPVTFRYLVLRKDTGAAGTSPLMGYVDFGIDQQSSTVFTVEWDTDGVFSGTVG